MVHFPSSSFLTLASSRSLVLGNADMKGLMKLTTAKPTLLILNMLDFSGKAFQKLLNSSDIFRISIHS